jgi:guanosine-3',5'-bis(diphosphate) 3'-pyrophosphohydrolase
LRESFGEKIASVVLEVTDDKTLAKHVRKQHQIDRASAISREARLVKLADKISNLREIANSPPANWDASRKREYFEWAGKVVDQIRGTNQTLEKLFDSVVRHYY